MRAPIGCTPGSAKTGVMLLENSGWFESEMRTFAEALGTRAALSTAAHSSARMTPGTEGFFPLKR